MEFLSGIWAWVMTAVGGVTLAGIISAIIYGSLKGAFNKTISKINMQKYKKISYFCKKLQLGSSKIWL